MSAESFSRGTRDNGLRCAGYAPLADLDPRIADAMLAALRERGIAAYAAPTPAASGGYGELRLPPRPIDRLWVDVGQTEQARGLLASETDAGPREPERSEPTAPADFPAPAAPAAVMPSADSADPAAPAAPAAGPEPFADDSDFDAAWQQVLTSLRAPSAVEPTPKVPWPQVDKVSAVDNDDADDEADLHDPADDEHYVPPPPPPVPRLRSVTLAAVLAIVLGMFILAIDFDGGSFEVPAFVAIVGGAVSLVWNMRQGPPTDSGWDDGAVV